MKWISTIWTWIKDTWGATADVISPRHCTVCNDVLTVDERYVCRKCLLELPLTDFQNVDFNVMEQLFAGRVPIERAAAYFYYEKGSPHASILHDMKYRNMPQLGRYMAARAAREMKASGLFDTVEFIVPVPLHRTKLAQRGYNQSDYLALGLSDATGIEVCHGLVATRDHSTQTRKGAVDRYLNTRGAYAVDKRHVAELAGRHIMLVDDVITTGATLLACAEVVKALPGTRVSVFTLAAARLS